MNKISRILCLLVIFAIPAYSQDTDTSKSDQKSSDSRTEGLKKIGGNSRHWDAIDEKEIEKNIEMAIETSMKALEVALEKMEVNMKSMEVNLRNLNMEPIKVKIPSITVPEINIPDVNIPEITIPEINVDINHHQFESDDNEDHDQDSITNDDTSTDQDKDKVKDKTKDKHKDKHKDHKDKTNKQDKSKGLKKLN